MFHNAALKRTALTPYDWGLVFAALALLMIGMVMVYSASIATAEAKSAANQPMFYLIRHSMYLVIGLGAGYAALQIPIDTWQKLAPRVTVRSSNRCSDRPESASRPEYRQTGASMSSEYNTRPLVPEVLVRGDEWAVVRPRPTYDEMLAREPLADWL